jgi:Ca2+-binding EF-hand superfamily protein
MKKMMLAAVALSLLTAPAAHAQTEQTRAERPSMDPDGDGRISRAEMTAAALARFDRLDADRNGTVTAEERRARFDARRGARDGEVRRGAAARFDANGDGQVSRAEYDQASEAARQRRFARVDLNSDGVWDRNEIQSLAARFDGDRMHSGHRGGRGGEGRSAAASTRADAERTASEHFDRLDANRDGYIGADERTGLKRGRGGRTGL